MKIKIIILLLIALFAWSCSSDDEPEKNFKYEEGVFIVNEGNFGAGTGTITFYDRDTVLEQKVFQQANPGKFLGNIGQSIIKVGLFYFIAVNNAGKVVMTDRINFQENKVLSGFAQPRSFAKFQEHTLFVSEWGMDGVTGKIHKLDATTGNILKTTPTLGGPEEMAVVDRNLYIAKSGGYGSDSLLLQYDIDTDEIVDSYIVGHNPTDIEVDRVGTLWILCSGLFDFSDPAGNTPGSLVQWDNGQVLKSIPLANGAANLTMDTSRDRLYFTQNGKIMQYDMTGSSDPVEFYDGFFYELSVDPATSNVYASDAKDYASNGEVIIISHQGQLLDRLEAGIIPGHIYFAE